MFSSGKTKGRYSGRQLVAGPAAIVCCTKDCDHGHGLRRLIRLMTLGICLFSLSAVGCATAATLVISTETPVEVEVTAYDGLKQFPLFTAELTGKGQESRFTTDHRGLVLLAVNGGQRYPLILDGSSVTLHLTPELEPQISGSKQNILFYKALHGSPVTVDSSFLALVLDFRLLLTSSYSIRSLPQLDEKKQEFFDFVLRHYPQLRHSDMLRQLVSQSFMMLEYVEYHHPDEPAVNLRKRYEEEVMVLVEGWLAVLEPEIAGHEFLNYILSFYYRRSMVSLGHKIVGHFPEQAICPGEERFSLPLSGETILTDGRREWRWDELKGRKSLVFVSENCPVSLVEAVARVRQYGGRETVVVVPLEELSTAHLAIKGMVSQGRVVFVKDGPLLDPSKKRPRLPLCRTLSHQP